MKGDLFKKPASLSKRKPDMSIVSGKIYLKERFSRGRIRGVIEEREHGDIAKDL